MKKDIINKQLDFLYDSIKLSNITLKNELNYTNAFELYVALVLSARTNDKQVNKTTFNLFKIIKTPDDVINIGEQQLSNMISSINFYKNKAKYIFNGSKYIKDIGYMPSCIYQLIKIPGIGRKTANIILNKIFNKDVCGVDTHVARVSKRIGWSDKSNQKGIETDIYNNVFSVIDKSKHKDVNDLLVLHGRYVCKSKKPLCSQCKMPFCLFRCTV